MARCQVLCKKVGLSEANVAETRVALHDQALGPSGSSAEPARTVAATEIRDVGVAVAVGVLTASRVGRPHVTWSAARRILGQHDLVVAQRSGAQTDGAVMAVTRVRTDLPARASRGTPVHDERWSPS